MHKPVLLAETIRLLNPKSGGTYVDLTFGGGGHTRAILDEADVSRVVAFDEDPKSVERAAAFGAQYGDRFIFFCENFINMNALVRSLGIRELDGVIADLGLSSYQIDDDDRGFSFSSSERPDMRRNPASGGPSAWEIVNNADEKRLTDILRRYGEEPFARSIARAIVRAREASPIRTSAELAAIVRRAIPTKPRRGVDGATRTFQALRIAVNNELDDLAAMLGDAFSILAVGGRLGVISFHSLEDRIVKEFFRGREGVCACPPGLPICRCGKVTDGKVLTRKPVVPSAEEIAANPRASSAKLRFIERTKSN